MIKLIHYLVIICLTTLNIHIYIIIIISNAVDVGVCII